MNKAELVSAVAARQENVTKKAAAEQVDAFVETIKEALVNGDKVQIVGFGTFEVAERAERTGRNPQTGEEITIPAYKLPKFKSSKVLKEMVNA